MTINSTLNEFITQQLEYTKYANVKDIVKDIEFIIIHTCGITDNFDICTDERYIYIIIEDYNINQSYKLPKNIIRNNAIKNILK